MSAKISKKERAVILTANQIEFQSVRAHIESIVEETHEHGTIYERGLFQTESRIWEVGLAQIGEGNVVASAEVERAIAYFSPQVIFFLGTADGLQHVHVGDVVIATKVYGYESGKDEATSFLTRPEVHPSSYRLVQRANAEARKDDWVRRIRGQAREQDIIPQILAGPVAAGEKVIGSVHSEIVTLLDRNYNDALAIERSGHGFLAGVYRNDAVQALVVLGITTLLDEEDVQEARRTQALAASNASAFLFEVLAKLDTIGSARSTSALRSHAMKKQRTTKQDTLQALFTNIKRSPPPTNVSVIQQREAVVRNIYDKLKQNDVTALVLTGISGVGKSTLAALVYNYAELQHSLGNGLFTGEVLWLSCDAGTTLLDLVGTVFDALGKPLSDTHSLSPQELVMSLFSTFGALLTPHLLILDQFENLVDPTTGYALASSAGIDIWLDALNSRPCPCKVLLTSRVQPVGSRAYPVAYMQEFPVKGLEPTEGKAFLRASGIVATERELQTAVERCQGHAYALVLLVSLLLKRNLSLTTFFKDSMYTQLWTGDIAVNVLNYIYQHQLNALQHTLLLAFSVYREPMPSDAAQALLEETQRVSRIQIEQALDTLLSQRLLQAYDGRYQPHAIVVAYAHDHFAEENEQANTEARRMVHAKAARYYQGQAIAHGLSRTQRHHIHDVHALLEAAWHLCQARQYRAAYQLLQQENLFADLQRLGGTPHLLELYLLLLAEKEWFAEPSQKGRFYNELGEIYNVIGKRDEAKSYFERALSIFRVLNEHHGEAVALSNLGQIYRLLGNKEHALTCYREALQLHEAIGDRKGKGRALNDVGKALYDVGERQQASEYYEQALFTHRQEKTFDEEAWTLNNLGEVYHNLQQNDTALPFYKQALELFLQLENRRGESITRNNLGVLFKDLGKREEAKKFYVQALVLFRDIGDRRGEWTVLSNLGRFYLAQSRYEQCLACFLVAQEVLQTLEQVPQAGIPRWLYALLRKQVGEGQFEKLLADVEPQTHQLIEWIVQER